MIILLFYYYTIYMNLNGTYNKSKFKQLYKYPENIKDFIISQEISKNTEFAPNHKFLAKCNNTKITASNRSKEILHIADSKKNSKIISLSLDNSNILSEITNNNYTTLPTANNSESKNKVSFPSIENNLKNSTTKSKFFSELNDEEITQNTISNKNYEENYFNSNFDSLKINLEYVKKNVNLVEKKASYKITKEENSLHKQLENFLKRAETNFNYKLYDKLEELEIMLKSIHSFNQEIVKSYEILKEKNQERVISIKEMKSKIEKSKIIFDKLMNYYKENKYLRKKLIERINEKKIKMKNNLRISTIHNEKNLNIENEINLPNCIFTQKSEKIKKIMGDTLNKMNFKNIKLKQNLKKIKSDDNNNIILDRIQEIIANYKGNKKRKEQFHFYTDLTAYHNDYKKSFYSSNALYVLKKDVNNITNDNQKSDSIIDIKCMIELFTNDEIILNRYNEKQKLIQDFDFETY